MANLRRENRILGVLEHPRAQGLGHGYPFERVLVPLDGSGSSEGALPVARALCRHHGSLAILARILEPHRPASDPTWEREALHFARLYLENVSAHLEEDDVRTRVVLRAGPAARTILAVAEDVAAPLIVMSTHGRLTPPARPLGPVGEELFQSSRIPILAVPPRARGPRGGEPEARPILRTLLLPQVARDPSKDLLSVAAEFALAFGADLAVFLQVIPPAPLTGRQEAESYVEAHARLRRVAQLFEQSQIPTQRVIREGDPVQAVLGVSQELGADLIALDSDPEEPAGGELLRGLLVASKVPVLTLPVPAEEPPLPPGR